VTRWNFQNPSGWIFSKFFLIPGPKWPMKHSPGFTPGLPWVNFSKRIGPEGAVWCGAVFLRIVAVACSPLSGPNAFFWLSRAMLS
jgi:hypothetical protein